MDFMYTETAERLPKCVRGGGDSNKKRALFGKRGTYKEKPQTKNIPFLDIACVHPTTVMT